MSPLLRFLLFASKIVLVATQLANIKEVNIKVNIKLILN